MKAAIPLFGDDVSPRFGCSGRFLVASIEENRVQARNEEAVTHLDPWKFPEFLASQGVTQVICGGVHRRFQMELERLGIKVIWGVIGPAEEALAAFLNGTLKSNQFVCGDFRKRRGRGHGHQGPGHKNPPGRGGRRGGGYRRNG